jgi:hypothetical protein
VFALCCNANVELFDGRTSLAMFDKLVRPSMEAFVIHTWYCDLWDVASNDDAAWTPEVLKKVKAFVDEDRRFLCASSENVQVSATTAKKHSY